MSDFTFSCPHCQQHLSADASIVGMKVACPTCAHQLVVPEQPVPRSRASAPVAEAKGTCPYCRTEIAPTDRARVCPSCHTPHHADCWKENKGCTVFGCSMAPPDEEKISLAGSLPRGESPPVFVGNMQIPNPSGFVPSGPQVRPWVRYWARTIDEALFGIMSGIVLAMIHPPALELNGALLGVMFSFVYAFVEPGMLCSWGTTPGKALLNIRLRKADESLPSYGDALSRAFNVWTRGMGLGIPIVAFFTQLNAYSKLSKDGITSWDKEGGFRISHKKVGAGRVIAIIALLIGFVFLISLGEMQ